MKTKIISIDFQKDFTAEGGICYKPRPSVDFVKKPGVQMVAKIAKALGVSVEDLLK